MRKFNLVILIMSITLVFCPVYCDNSNNCWKGYGLYNLNNSDTTIQSENVKIQLIDDKILYNGEFIIKNNSKDTIEAIFGMPLEGITSISAINKGINVKTYLLNQLAVNKIVGDIELLPKEEKWRAFSLWMKPDEVFIINITLECRAKKEGEDKYVIEYLQDRDNCVLNDSDIIDLKILLPDYQIYNVLEISGVKSQDFNDDGTVKYHSSDKIEKIRIIYQLVEQEMLKNLEKANVKSIGRVINSFRVKDFQSAIKYCDAFLNESNDINIKNQVRYIKAESKRRLNLFDDYIKEINIIDLDTLYPKAIIEKISIDKINIYRNKKDIVNLNSEIQAIKSRNNIQIMNNKVQNDMMQDEVTVTKLENTEEKTIDSNKVIKFDGFVKLLNSDQKNIYMAGLIGVFFLGVLIGRFTKKNGKKQRSVYMFRN